ncbi:hypothetical protein N7509_007417 [Penicillium cosmopolitanum]|uniref:Beta-galactosidase n=1 Tax=Penicillium cosmopolitanum TaxID=1131564 RepID=A0A9X0B8D5_9EURO|nr:uncharacterized protein N7509_007417 [Penicillium cosmopolitanum]KAJ5391927.1 hypothetical protein N7509_007417 [Penicillium cosmopolitanum]
MWLLGLQVQSALLSSSVDAKLIETGNGLQDLVTWDKHSVFVRGERIMIFSGEFHPFRLPVPGLWLDVFQKIKSMGFNGVSFYVDWSLVEGNPGQVVTEGIWNLDKFFDAATEAGIYLIARPGPYINAETTAGGQRKNICQQWAELSREHRSPTGGPVIMVQPENEYATWPDVSEEEFPTQMNREYMKYVEKQLLNTGITVPLIVNDNKALGYWAPGSGLGATDIYGIDSYPLRYDCGNPTFWPTYRFPYDWQALHEKYSPNTPFSIVEFQGGSGGGWGGVVEDKCAELVNEEAVRVVYKNNYGFGVKIFNIYMTFGGTNWGNLGYQGGYTSYDYGAAITEARGISREKYSEQKLEANFLKVSRAYLTATPGFGFNGSYGAPASIAVTPLRGNDTQTNFYLVRHANFSSTSNTKYTLHLPTSIGNISIPQLGGHLNLNGRDSKFHVTDYNLDGINLIYSTAEIFTWARGAGSARVLILYGGAGELHEFALSRHLGNPTVVEGSDVTLTPKGQAWVIQWQVKRERRIVRVSDLEIHLLWRNEAYEYWPLELAAEEPIGNFSSPSKDMVIVKGGNLIRSIWIEDQTIRVTGDINATTEIEVISAPMRNLKTIIFNENEVQTSRTKSGKLTATLEYNPPKIKIPSLANLDWKFLDSLPEIKPGYDDSKWTPCSKKTTNNPRGLDTPTNLYSMDYGFHTGSLIYRGHFVANGMESLISLNVSGGTGFGHSIWLNETFLGSWTGSGSNTTAIQNLQFPNNLSAGQSYVLTILIDDMGQDEEAPGTDAIKFPHGILSYQLLNHSQTDISWKVTGNLGGEQYHDLARGPLNEGAMYAERQGYHNTKPPASKWLSSSPIKDGIATAGVGFFTTSFSLDIPQGWDVPMSFVFNGSAAESPESGSFGSNYRCQLFVNGYQFGKYINNLGPQVSFPVPEGILNHNGLNYIALTLWAQDEQGAQLVNLELTPTAVTRSGYTKPDPAPQPSWVSRQGAY